jgi:hypothetical protein
LSGVVIGPLAGLGQVFLHSSLNLFKGLSPNNAPQDDKSQTVILVNLIWGHRGHVPMLEGISLNQ